VTTDLLKASDGGSEWDAISRRSLITSTASAVALAPVLTAAQTHTTTEAPRKSIEPQTAVTLDLVVNRQVRHLMIDPRTTLLDALREHLGLTGAKKGCDHGQCGAYTVLVDDARVLGCLTLAVAVRGPGGDYRRPRRAGRRSAPNVTGIYRSGCLSMRLLYAGSDPLGDRLHQ
jgi:hypothetical protein